MQGTKRESLPVRVSVFFGENGTVYGCGHALDTLLLAHGLETEESTLERSTYRERDGIQSVLDSYDFTAATVRRLNALPATAMLAEILEKRIPVGVLAASEIEASDYLPGDWLRFNDPAALKCLEADDERTIREAVDEEIGDWSSGKVPEDLRNGLTRAVEEEQEETQREWLHGDRLMKGALHGLAIAMFGRYTLASVEWETAKDTVHIDAWEEEWREWLGYDLDEREPLPSPDKLAEEVKAYALRKAEAVAAQDKRNMEARQSDRRERERIEAERLEKEKEAARERKRQRAQA